MADQNERMEADRAAFEALESESTVPTTNEDQPVAAAPAQESAETAQAAPDVPSDFEQRARWDNIPEKIIQSMKADPDAVAEYYERAKIRHERTDALYRDRDALKRARAELEQTKTTEVEPQPKKPSLVELLGENADQLGSEVVEALQAYVDDRVQPIAPAPEQQEPQFDPERERVVTEEVEANRARLQEMYSGYRLDGAEWAELVSEANSESQNPIYASPQFEALPYQEKMRHIFDVAMMRMYPGATPQPAMQGTTIPSGPVTRNGAASSPSIAQTPPDMTPKEREKVIFEHLTRNPGDMDGARTAAGLEPLNQNPRFSRRKL